MCRVQRTERLDEAAPESLAVCPGLTCGGGGCQGLLGFLGTPIPGTGWPQRGGFAHGQPNLLSESRALSFLCFTASASRKNLALPLQPENLDDDAQGRRQRAAFSGSDLNWVPSSGLGRVQQGSQAVLQKGRERKGMITLCLAVIHHLLRFPTPCEMNILIPTLQM